MWRRTSALLLATLAAVVMHACGRTSTPGASAGPDGATVERVVDGDTIVVHLGGRRERVRLIGIDTPESVKPNTPVQCFALEASGRTKALLPKGTPVRLVRTSKRATATGACWPTSTGSETGCSSTWPSCARATPRPTRSRPTWPTPTSSSPPPPKPATRAEACGQHVPGPAALRRRFTRPLGLLGSAASTSPGRRVAARRAEPAPRTGPPG